MYQHTIPILHQIDFSFFMGFLKSSYLRAEQKLGDLQVSQTSSALTNPTLGCHPKSMIRVDLCLDYTLKNWIGKIGHSKDMSSSKYISIEYWRCSSHFLQTIHVVSCWFFPCRVTLHVSSSVSPPVSHRSSPVSSQSTPLLYPKYSSKSMASWCGTLNIARSFGNKSP